jgi:hypothetical protein
MDCIILAGICLGGRVRVFVAAADRIGAVQRPLPQGHGLLAGDYQDYRKVRKKGRDMFRTPGLCFSHENGGVSVADDTRVEAERGEGT